MNSYQRLMKHVNGTHVDQIPAQPIIMRWVAKKLGIHYREFCMNPRVKVDANLYLAEEFGVDGVDVMSDPYAEAYDHGAELIWFADKSPALKSHVIEVVKDLESLLRIDPKNGRRMCSRLEEISLYKDQVKGGIPIVGWIEGPLAQACIFRDLSTVMIELIQEPEFIADLLDWMTELEIRFAKEQIAAGADVIGVGDSVASLVSPDYFSKELAPRHKKIVETIHGEGALARLHICGNIDGKAQAIGSIGYEIVDVDHLTDLRRFREEIGPDVILQGNVDPVEGLERATPGDVYNNFVNAANICGVRRMIGAGCEITPDTSEENIRAMMRVTEQI